MDDGVEHVGNIFLGAGGDEIEREVVVERPLDVEALVGICPGELCEAGKAAVACAEGFFDERAELFDWGGRESWQRGEGIRGEVYALDGAEVDSGGGVRCKRLGGRCGGGDGIEEHAKEDADETEKRDSDDEDVDGFAGAG